MAITTGLTATITDVNLSWIGSDAMTGSVCVSVGPTPLKQGDRVRIREGYAASGDIGLYGGMSATNLAMVMVHDLGGCKGECTRILAAAIEPYPLTRDERIEAAIEDYRALSRSMLASINCRPSPMTPETRALLHAILDAGV